jgi:hypothetical protein
LQFCPRSLLWRLETRHRLGHLRAAAAAMN